jgi:hypothetical protein
MSEPQRARRRGRRERRLAWLIAVSLMLAGCGGESRTPTVASLPGHVTAGQRSSAVPTSEQSDRDMVAFTRCMRSHGVQMSDPFHRPGHEGLSIDMPTQDAATAVAYRACNPIMQPIFQAKQQAEATAAGPLLGALARYAACMRSHDIDMLDPTPQGQLNLGTVPAITADYGRYSTQFRAADTACRHLLPASIHDDGTGP